MFTGQNKTWTEHREGSGYYERDESVQVLSNQLQARGYGKWSSHRVSTQGMRASAGW